MRKIKHCRLGNSHEKKTALAAVLVAGCIVSTLVFPPMILLSFGALVYAFWLVLDLD